MTSLRSNGALLMTDAQQYELSPTFDVLPSGQALGFQQIRVGEQEADSTVANALSLSPMYALAKNEAVKEARAVARVIDGWQQHFMECGVTRGDIELYAEQIDRQFLRDQRSELR
jgi:serine/threonine-protein kinase HipA